MMRRLLRLFRRPATAGEIVARMMRHPATFDDWNAPVAFGIYGRQLEHKQAPISVERLWCFSSVSVQLRRDGISVPLTRRCRRALLSAWAYRERIRYEEAKATGLCAVVEDFERVYTHA